MLKKVIALCLCFLLAGCGTGNTKKTKCNIVTSSFVAYDALRAITGDDHDYTLSLLIKPGSDSHSYEPSPDDIIKIQQADLFIYVGGESDTWVSEIIKNMPKKKIIRLMDLVGLRHEEEAPGMESAKEEVDDEYDEHVWTSLANEKMIVQKLAGRLMILSPENKQAFIANRNAYTKQLDELDQEIKQIVERSKRKELVFGDRFPLLYFVKEYGLQYHAAFPGCSEQSEPSAKTLSYLIDHVRKNKIPVVFAIELSNKQIANTIAGETGAKVRTFYTMHNISAKDFKDHETYISLMKKNIKVLKEALL